MILYVKHIISLNSLKKYNFYNMIVEFSFKILSILIDIFKNRYSLKGKN